MLTRISAVLLSGLFLIPALAAAEAPAPDAAVKPGEPSLSSPLQRYLARHLEDSERAPSSTLPSSGYVPPSYQTNRLSFARPALIATRPAALLSREAALLEPSTLRRRAAYSRLLAELGSSSAPSTLQERFEKPVPHMCRITSKANCLQFSGPAKPELTSPSTVREPVQPSASPAPDREMLLGMNLPSTT